MQLRNRYVTSTGVVLLAIAALTATPPAAAQGKDDLWETSSKIDMPGMPMAMPAQVNRVCLGKNRKDEDLIPRQENCRVTDSKRTGNRLTYRMECTGSDPAVIVGDLTLGNNSYEGQMKMTMTKTNDTMNMALSGRRVGDCTAR
jgi:hypothetical protein